jgi:hypothetical protein
MCEHATAKERAQLLLDEAWCGLFAERGTPEEALELLADDLVEERPLRLVALVVGHAAPCRDRSWGVPLERLGARPRYVTGMCSDDATAT